MRRSVAKRISLIRSCRYYSTGELAELLRVTKGTIRQWQKEGLEALDPNCKPFLFRGRDAKQYLQARNQRRKRRLRDNEFFCFKCRKPRKSLPSTLSARPLGDPDLANGKLHVQGKCTHCGTAVNRYMNETGYQRMILALGNTRDEERLYETSLPLVNPNIQKEETDE